MANQCKAFATFDLLFSAIPLIMIVANLLSFVHFANAETDSRIEAFSVERKLFSVSEYAVKYAAAEKKGEVGFGTSFKPNLIDEAEFSGIDADELAESADLSSLEIGWAKGEGTCIYRLVVHKGEIEKLYFCGG